MIVKVVFFLKIHHRAYMSRNKAYGQLWENIWPVKHYRSKWNKMYPGDKIYELGSEAEVIWGSMCLESQERLYSVYM